jgi:dTDP-4-dehydrorhamnose 3,5-epimerase
MKVIDTALVGVKIIEPSVFGDHRGFFKETFSAQRYKEQVGIELEFVQDNHSRSCKGVLRGLHFQKTKPQGKLVSVTRGAVYDVVADVNPESQTFGLYVGVELSDDNHRQLWIPPGYAHGFVVLSDEVDFVYKCTDYYDPSDEGGVAWNCPVLNIDWPLLDVQLSEKDQQYPSLKAMATGER